MTDLRHAWRSIVRMPVLATVVVVSLGVGIGVNTVVFSWIRAAVLRPLPGVRDAGGFHLVEPRAETGSYPLQNGSLELEDRSLRGCNVMGRLQPGVTIAQAQAEGGQAMRELASAYPEANAKIEVDVLPFRQAPRGPQRMFAQALMILQAVMLVLLLAVCGNTANLVLARASARHREIGVRLALGAGPGASSACC
jgi:hypothetical protein